MMIIVPQFIFFHCNTIDQCYDCSFSKNSSYSYHCLSHKASSCGVYQSLIIKVEINLMKLPLKKNMFCFIYALLKSFIMFAKLLYVKALDDDEHDNISNVH
jgi:hypothetical protein